VAVPGVQRSVLPARAEAHQKPAGGPVSHTILPSDACAHAARHMHQEGTRPNESGEPGHFRRGVCNQRCACPP
jgi:hypothetical protein